MVTNTLASTYKHLARYHHPRVLIMNRQAGRQAGVMTTSSVLSTTHTTDPLSLDINVSIRIFKVKREAPTTIHTFTNSKTLIRNIFQYLMIYALYQLDVFL